MSDRAWKAWERRLAGILGGRRVPVSGRGDGPDIAHRWLGIEAKERRDLPAWIEDALQQAERSADEDQLPIAVLHGHGRPAREAWVVLRLGDFTDWFV